MLQPSEIFQLFSGIPHIWPLIAMSVVNIDGQIVESTGLLKVPARLFQEGVDRVFKVGVGIPALKIAAC